VSDDIPIIFAEELRRGAGPAPAAVFFSGASTSQLQQYATAGWQVIAAPGFRSDAEVDLAAVPAVSVPLTAIDACTLLSCEAKFLPPDAAAHIRRWQPTVLKFNCAFYDIADASALASSMTGLGYTVLAALWRDDNSFGHRSLSNFGRLDTFPNREWDRTNLIGVRDAAFGQALLTVARLYVGEERRIAEMRVANTIRNDYIARLEDALQAHQKS